MPSKKQQPIKQRLYDFTLYEDAVPYFGTPDAVASFAYKLSQAVSAISDEDFGRRHKRLSFVYDNFYTGLSRLGTEAHTAKIHEVVNFSEPGFPGEVMQTIFAAIDAVQQLRISSVINCSRYRVIPKGDAGSSRWVIQNYLSKSCSLHNEICSLFVEKYAILSIEELQDTMKYADPTWRTGKSTLAAYVKNTNPSPLFVYAAETRLVVLGEMLKGRRLELRNPLPIYVGEDGTERSEKFV